MENVSNPLGRLIYHDAPLIILDEPSASLDQVGERQIFELLTRLVHDKIILFTTHRYDTIRRAHNIVVLVDGKLAEVGAPEELKRKAERSGNYILGKDWRSGS